MNVIVPTISLILVVSISMLYAQLDTSNDSIIYQMAFADNTCKSDMVYTQRPSGTLACVTPETRDVLIMRGWLPHSDTKITSTTDRPDYTPKDIISTNNDFAINFYKTIYNDTDYKDKNIFFSPTSMIVAFSMLYEGAREDTATQIEDVFGFDPDTQSRHDTITELMTSLNPQDQRVTLTLANALWVAKQYELYESYTDTIRNVYLADVENVDFIDPTDGVAKINSWADDKTNGKIKKVIDPQDVNVLTLAVLNNAIYFQGNWLTPFSEDDTVKKNFWTGTSYVGADFMNHLYPVSFKYVAIDDVQLLQLPYEGDRFSMLIILPNDPDGIATLEESISSDMIKEWRDALYYDTVLVSLPKFETSTKYELNKPLKEMGMPDAFDKVESNLLGIADVSGLPGNIYVSNATQDAYVKVNEKGTEAAGLTTMTLTIESAPYHFNANHPFIFLIQDDQSGAILFMGKIVDPTLG